MKHFVSILFICTIFMSCNQKKAVDYNNTVIDFEKSITVTVQKSEAKIQDLFQAQDWDGIKKESSKTLKKIKSVPERVGRYEYTRRRWC